MIEGFVTFSVLYMIYLWRKAHIPEVTQRDLYIALAAMAIHVWFLWCLAVT